jgi:hypothetical protein
MNFLFFFVYVCVWGGGFNRISPSLLEPASGLYSQPAESIPLSFVPQFSRPSIPPS